MSRYLIYEGTFVWAANLRKTDNLRESNGSQHWRITFIPVAKKTIDDWYFTDEDVFTEEISNMPYAIPLSAREKGLLDGMNMRIIRLPNNDQDDQATNVFGVSISDILLLDDMKEVVEE